MKTNGQLLYNTKGSGDDFDGAVVPGNQVPARANNTYVISGGDIDQLAVPATYLPRYPGFFIDAKRNNFVQVEVFMVAGYLWQKAVNLSGRIKLRNRRLSDSTWDLWLDATDLSMYQKKEIPSVLWQGSATLGTFTLRPGKIRFLLEYPSFVGLPPDYPAQYSAYCSVAKELYFSTPSISTKFPAVYFLRLPFVALDPLNGLPKVADHALKLALQSTGSTTFQVLGSQFQTSPLFMRVTNIVHLS